MKRKEFIDRMDEVIFMASRENYSCLSISCFFDKQAREDYEKQCRSEILGNYWLEVGHENKIDYRVSLLANYKESCLMHGTYREF